MSLESQTNANSPTRRIAPPDVQAFRVLIEQFTGLHFDDWRLDTLEKALLARMCVKGTRHVEAYLDLLRDSAGRPDELSELLNQLTVNETYFFRYPAQFDFLRQHVLPDLVAGRGDGRVPLQIWSAGCSTGEEPYSIAMTALDVLGSAASHLIQIFATDVSSAALQAARHAEYSTKSLRLVDEANRSKYFRRVSDNRFVLCNSVRQMVLVSESNLLDDVRRRAASWDIIFCRNVLIYFASELAVEILDGLHQCLNTNGYLFVGHSEIFKRTSFVPCQPEAVFAYQKVKGELERSAFVERQEAARSAPTIAARDIETTRPQVAVPRTTSSVSELQREDATESLYEEAFVSFEREDYARARSQLDRLLESSPRHLPATVLRANLHLNLGEHYRSVEECEVALQLDPLAHEAHLLLGMNFQKLSKPELAVLQLKKAAYISPDSAIVQFQLGEAYRTLQRWDDAARAYRSALPLFQSTTDQEIRAYSGGFGKSALNTLSEQIIAASQAHRRDS